MCGARLYRGAPKAHGMLFVFIGLCIFIPVFSATGGMIRVLPHLGINTSGMRPTGGPGLVPMVIGFLGISVCLTISRTRLPAATQMVYCGVVTGLCWIAFIVFVTGFAKEMQSPRKRYVESAPGREGFDRAPVDAGRSAAMLADVRRVPVREAGALA
jgi:hypothetical protein